MLFLPIIACAQSNQFKFIPVVKYDKTQGLYLRAITSYYNEDSTSMKKKTFIFSLDQFSIQQKETGELI